MGIEFSLLGPLTVHRDGLAVPVPGGKPRAVLAALLLDSGELVTVGQLAEVLWGADPPPSARVSVQNHVKRLRQALGEAGRDRIVTQPGGYVMNLEAGELDVSRFRDSVTRAQAAARARMWEEALEQASAALLLWHGEPLADSGSDLLAQRAAPYLSEMRLRASEVRLEAQIQLGQSAEAISELRRLVAANPLREHLHALLILALRQCGRRGEALAAYQASRRILIDELGAEPGLELRQVHQRVLADDQDAADDPDAADDQDAAAAPARAADRVPPVVGTRQAVIPRQLPAQTWDFVGRHAELTALTSLLSRTAIGAPALVISAIGGTAGVGKTALALHWAHQVAGRFTDGQLYVNLRGFDPSGVPATPETAMRGFLDALGVPPERIPPDPDAQASLYRSLLADRTMLIVLDNARDERQVRPLLPGSPDSMVIVTSRSQLAGLTAACSARLLNLDVLTRDEAVRLLTARLGADRANAEPAAVGEIADLCAHLPLALAVGAARAAARPGFPLAALALELRDVAGRLDALDVGDPEASVRAVFSWSYEQLSAEAARMFRLLGLHPGPDISVPAAASLSGSDQVATSRQLRELARAHLIAEQAPGRYSFHDLLRAYAAAEAVDTDSVTDRDAAVGRLLDHYLHTACDASLVLSPAREPVAPAPPRPGAIPEQFADHQQALAWFEAEHQVLLALIAVAESSGPSSHAWQLPWAMVPFLDNRGHYQDWAGTQRSALAAATRAGDITGQAAASRLLADGCLELGDFDQALGHYLSSLRLYQRLGSRLGEASVYNNLSWLAERQGHYADALGHAERALDLHRATANKAAEAAALNNVGWCHALLGDYLQARSYCGQALVLSAEISHRRVEANAWDSLGYAEHQLGNLGEAAVCYQRALAIAREVGYRWGEAEALAHLGDTRHAAGDSRQAREAWQQALVILEDIRHADAPKVRAKLDDTDADRTADCHSRRYITSRST